MSLEDNAQELELLNWQRNNQVRETKKYTPNDAGYGPTECDECLAAMPILRREDGRRLCTACQTVKERAEKKFRSKIN